MIEEGLSTYLNAQTAITDIVENRIYPVKFPQEPVLPALVFIRLSTTSAAPRQNGASTLDKSHFQFDAYANDLRDAKLLSDAVREALESYVGMMGSYTVRATYMLDHGIDDFDDIPNDYRVTSEYEIWHTV